MRGRFETPLPSTGYGNWELSVDRANAARRLLHTSGIRSDQVVEVRGYADQNFSIRRTGMTRGTGGYR